MAGRSSTSGGTRLAIAGLGLALALGSTIGTAEARGHRHRAVRARAAHHHLGSSALNSPAFAAMVVDVNTGRTLYADHENDLRHPASITKVMTLFLLFEKLDRGEMTLNTPLTVSRHAASMSPTKLGLRPGSTIAVENAIKAIVTKSANDMAVAVAEAIGGDEDTFAAMMTRKAHSLGMSRTTYVNASGLPDNRQITTARDLTLLGRAIQDRFPNYYHYFSTPSFTYGGSFMANHNHLMERVQGMDGIKTGYTNASGFNLLSNVNRDGHHIVAVVMGGKSAAGRDRIMEGLIAQHLEEAAPTRIAGRIEEQRPIEPPAATVQVADDMDSASEAHDQSPSLVQRPSLIAPTMAVPPVPVVRQRVAMADRPRPAFVSGATRMIDAERLPPPMAANERKRIALDGSTSGRAVQGDSNAVALVTSTPSTLRWVAGPQARPMPPMRPGKPTRIASNEDETASIRPQARNARSTETAPAPSPTRGGGWIIQIGATVSATEAIALLDKAKSDSRSTLGSARPVTEKVRKGSATLYRARFAGLAPEQAQAACKSLKRSGFACFASKD